MPFLLALLLAVPGFVWAASPDLPAATAMWDAPMAAFAAADAKHAPPPGGVLFVGSSSIRLWDGLESDFHTEIGFIGDQKVVDSDSHLKGESIDLVAMCSSWLCALGMV